MANSLIEALNYLEQRKAQRMDAWSEAVVKAKALGFTDVAVKTLEVPEIADAYWAMLRDFALCKDIERLAWEMANDEAYVPGEAPASCCPPCPIRVCRPGDLAA